KESTEHTTPRQKQKTSRINNTLHLWEFLFELLEDERYTALIAWTRKDKGEFKIKRQEDVARKWGRLKQRTSMNYDKLSRALRYYYHKGIIKKVPGQRLAYKFDKLPYSYKPIRYNWPWNPPGEDDDIKPDRQVLDTSPATKAASWPLFLEWNDLEKHVKREKLDIVTSPAYKKTFCPMTPTWEHPSQGVCRSQIIFPPCSCSCMRSMACGMYLVPDVPPQVPGNVLMRFA
ncbi:unnamed protein product, partial [Porites lobata]